MGFSQDFIEKVRDSNNLIDILSEFTNFKRTGGQHMACCPLPGHNEKTPSFSASEPKQVYHCFGCGRSGNIFDALRELKGFSFPESVEYLATRAGLAIPQENQKPGDDLRRKEKLAMIQACETAAKFFESSLTALPTGHAVHSYMQNRGLTEEISQLFRIGYAQDEWEGLVSHLKAKKLNLGLAEKVGLIKPRNKGDGHFDIFRHRLVFPIQNLKGDVVAFSGRVLDKDQNPKYLNSPESDVFHKGKMFYGLNVTNKFIREKDQVLVVEGQMDLLALFSAGIKNVVAPLGTAFTDSHARLIRRFTDNVIIVFDGDKAGKKAAERSLPVLLAEGLVPKIALIPDGKDPDDYVKEVGTEKFQQLLTKAPELFQWVLEQELGEFRGTPAEKIKALDKMAPYLNVISDDRLKSLYTEAIATRLQVEPKLVRQSISNGPDKDLIQKTVTPVTPEEPEFVLPDEVLNAPKVVLTGAPKSELYLLNLALSDLRRWHEIWGSGAAQKMSPNVQKVFLIANEFFGQNPSNFDKLTAYLMNKVDAPKVVSFHLTSGFVKLSAGELDRMQADCLRQMTNKFTQDQLRQIKSQMQNKSPEEQLKELERIVNMKKENTINNRKAESKES